MNEYAALYGLVNHVETEGRQIAVFYVLGENSRDIKTACRMPPGFVLRLTVS